MIIVEGPDGAGKTSLIRRLSQVLDLPVHARSANSDGTATQSTEDSRGANLSVWAFKDVNSMDDQPLSIYDRHCLISEYIYGPITRGFIDPNMLSPVMHLSIRALAKKSFVIFCRPSNAEIVTNVEKDDVSKAVVGNNAHRLAYAYDALKMFWPGDNIYYDYQAPYAFDNVLAGCRLHIAKETKRREFK